LVYKAYDGIEQINIKPNEVNGRIILSPNQYAEKFSKEYNQMKKNKFIKKKNLDKVISRHRDPKLIKKIVERSGIKII
jgi:hypothetical protein